MSPEHYIGVVPSLTEPMAVEYMFARDIKPGMRLVTMAGVEQVTGVHTEGEKRLVCAAHSKCQLLRGWIPTWKLLSGTRFVSIVIL